MKYFTKAQVEELRKALATAGVRDSELPDAATLTGDELVAIVQDGRNVVVRAVDLFGENVPPEIFDNIKEGKSAYQIWLEAGNTGTVSDFLASLKGNDGRDGTNGTNGTDGANGANGRDGVSAGFGTPSASVDTTSSGQIGVSITASGPDTAKVFNFTFHNLASGGEGTPGRSIVGIDAWFKLSSSSTSVVPPALSIADPSSIAGGSWTLNGNSLSPTASLPYVWCFLQTNYDTALDNGYTYSRSGAYIARKYVSGGGGGQEYDDLNAMIEELRSDMEEAMAGYSSDLNALNTMLEQLRTNIQTTIAADIRGLNTRLSAVEGTDVKLISEEGLWGVLTTYYNQNGTASQKALAQILLDAVNAKATLLAGSSFFDKTVGVGLTLDGLDGRINACATRQDITDAIASATFDLDPAALSSILAKSQCGWEKDGALYQYDLYLVDFRTANPSGTLADYDTYMQTAAGSGGPSGDANRPAGPFTPIIVVNEFSSIKQTAEQIAASVDSYRYMWQDGNDFKSYDYFETEYEQSGSQLTYDQYVHDVKGYTKVAVGTALSNITQTAESIRSTVGEVGYLWYKPKAGGGYEYEAFVVPADATRTAYITAKQNAGWTLIDYAQKVSIVDQTPDAITLAVQKARLVWINSTLPGSNPAYCYEYEHWYNDWKNSSFSGTYEQYVNANYPNYALTKMFNEPGDSTNLGAISRIKLTESAITSAVSDITSVSNRTSAIEQTARDIKIGVGVTYKVWKNSVGDIKAYDAFMEEHQQSGSQLTYEAWVIGNKGYNLYENDAATSLAGLLIDAEKIWAGVGDGNGNVAASIEILANAETTRLWENTSGDLKDYWYFFEEYEADGSPDSYDSWVQTNKGYTLKTGSVVKLTADDIYVDGTLVAQIAKIADFKFQNQRLESTAVDDQGDPMIIIDGNTGKIESRGYLDEDYGYRESNTQTDEYGFSSSATWYASNSDNALGTFSAGINNEHGFVEIHSYTQGANRVHCAEYIQSFNNPALVIRTGSDETPSVRTAIDAEGDVSIDGSLDVTGVIRGKVVDKLNVISSSSTSLTALDGGTLVYSSGAAYVQIGSAITSGNVGFHFKVVAGASGSIISMNSNAIWTIVNGSSVTSSSASSSYTLPSAGAFEFVYVGTKNTYPEILVIY